MKSFLEAVNYQRRYIPNCATILRPLYEISSGERLEEWGPPQQKAFDTVKRLLTTAPVLASPRIGTGNILETDESKKGLGYVLPQPDNDGHNRVAAYGSRCSRQQQSAGHSGNAPHNMAVTALLTKEDRNLTSQTNKYRLAIKTNTQFDLSTAPERQTKWRTTSADTYPKSRRPPRRHQTPSHKHLQPNPNKSTRSRLMLYDSPARIRAEQRRETKLRQLYEALSIKHAFTANEKAKLSKRDGIVCYQAATDAAPRIWLPVRLREKAIRELHENPLAGGHFGTNKVELKGRQRFYWQNLHDDVSRVVSSCPLCQFRIAPTKITPTEPPSKWLTPRWPFDRIHHYLYGVLPLTKKRHRYILTVADALTKWICVIPPKGQTAQEFHDAFLNNVIAKYGICSSAITDQETQILGKPFDQLASIYGFQHIPISAHHQPSNGQIERFHKTHADMLSSYVANDPTTWDDYIARATMAYNCSVHAITGQSPFWSLYGSEPNLPLGLHITLFLQTCQQQQGQDGGIGENRGQDEAEKESTDQDAELAQTERLGILRRAWKDMKKTIEDKGAVRDAYRDDRVRAKAHQLKEGQLVLKRKPADEIRLKFDHRFDAPHLLKSVNPPNVTVQELHENAKPLTLHVDQIKPFKAAITLPIYSDCRDARSDAEGNRLDAPMNGELVEASSEEEREATTGDEVYAVRILPPSPHSITINENGYWKDVRDHRGHIPVFNANALEGRARICAFDSDEKLHRIHFCDFKLCVITNQLYVSNGTVDLKVLKRTIEDDYNAVAVPMQFFIAVNNGFYRKPNIGMF